MVQLPTIDVTQEQANRLLAAYGSASNYQAWLINSVLRYVESFEARAIHREVEADLATRLEALRASLPPARVFTPPDGGLTPPGG